LNLAKKSSVFEFDILINLKTNVNAAISFEYMCDNCKQMYPFAFSRCSNCHGIDTLRVEMSLSRDYSNDSIGENDSFQ
jgi:rRNA maturation endonuclease Nob1